MGKDLKTTWKETGKGIGFAFRDLGKAIIKTGSTAMKKADEWANGEEENEQNNNNNTDSEQK